MTLLAIWSVSAITSLPGLAVSPIIGQLDTIFTSVSKTEIQMLTSLPSMLIIPFVLLSGKLAVSGNKLLILITGLMIFMVSSVLYFFAESIHALLYISLLLGVGAGIVIPLSTSLINDFFAGKYRIRQFGISSFITNLTLVLATALTGWLAGINWHYPFIIYLLPGVAIALSYFLTRRYVQKFAKSSPGVGKKAIDHLSEESIKHDPKPIQKKPLACVMLLYFLATTIVLIIPFNVPFLIQGYHLSSVWAGWMLSLFFLAMMLPGLVVKELVDHLSNYTTAICFGSIALGLIMITATRHPALTALGIFIVGFSYGVIQPFIYDKTSSFSNVRQANLTLAMVMSMNYTAIVLFPLRLL
ncbi:MFS transporter [Endozoicomonas sp. SCSIO W0465]|uniref:MFS transporter n=1 Tax=Endozoicomonas sp. SCSIO W0465 TaxID=2918516 RepID=UPI0020751162|nr:MFS transporter [Endozoicomonas sp. SCSIO W0465]USE37992.1 MFS transporter [Endozoicomonas sp. SCSIO W0465]